ncbi:MAG: ankyrin repeat domain-containing protein, partial [Trinickia sp.]|uniref:ankyrin repeat domain-containing protein n=1 Tax=Trinickia sp. TaxID=2571163 RepID=UPI003F7F3A6D
MKINFTEGSSFHVEKHDDDAAGRREAVAQKAAQRYGERPVYFNALQHGSFSAFEQSPEYVVSKAQIRKNVDSLKQFLERKQTAQHRDASAQIETFAGRVEAGSSGYFSTRVVLAHTQGKEALEQLAYRIEDPAIDEDKREQIVRNLAPGLIVCADGAITHLINSAREIDLEGAGGLRFNAKTEWERMLTQAILEFTQRSFGMRQHYQPNEVHYHNACWNHLVSDYGTDPREDAFIPSLGISDGDLAACKQHVIERVTPGRLVRHVAENCLAEIRGRFNGFTDRTLSADEVWAFYQEFAPWAETELRERFGPIEPEALFVSGEDEDGETSYRMTQDPVLLMPQIGANLVKSDLLNDFPVRVVRGGPSEQIVELGYQAFIVHDEAQKKDRSLVLRDLGYMHDALTPAMVMAALNNTPHDELIALAPERMLALLDTERAPVRWLAQLSDPVVRRYWENRSDTGEILTAPIVDKLNVLGSAQRDAVLLGAAKAGDERLTAFLVQAFTQIRGIDERGNAVVHYAASQGMVRPIERLAGKIDVNMRNRDNRTALMLAAQSGQAGAIRALKSAGADVELTNEAAETALMIAARKGRVEAIEALHESGANLERTNVVGWSALLIAAAHDQPRALAALLARGANLEHQDNYGWSVLHVAASNGGTRVFAELMARGMDPEQTTATGITALMLAAAHGRVPMIEALADAEVYVDRVTGEGLTAVMFAAQVGQAAAIDALAARGANLDLLSDGGLSALMMAAQHGHVAAIEMLIDRGAARELPDAHGWSALVLAAMMGKTAAVRALAARGANVDHADAAGMTALMSAAGSGKLTVAEALIESGADLDRADRILGATALMYAATSGHIEIVDVLLAKRADVARTDSKGWSALMHAANGGGPAVVTALLNAGADIRHTALDGRDALMVAASIDAHASIEALAAAGAEIDRTDASGQTALMIAAARNGHDSVRLLAARGAEIEKRDANGRTALIIAAEQGHGEAVNALLALGGDIGGTDNEGMTALLAAARTCDTELVETLIAHGADVEHANALGQTAMMLAARDGDADMIAVLIDHDAQVDRTDAAGR